MDVNILGKSFNDPLTSATYIELNYLFISTLNDVTPCGPGEGKIGWECDLLEALGQCEECGKSLETSGKMNHHIVTNHMSGRCHVCGRGPKHSKQMQVHKMGHIIS